VPGADGGAGRVQGGEGLAVRALRQADEERNPDTVDIDLASTLFVAATKQIVEGLTAGMGR
jgi:hypothetical protein